MNLVDDLYRQQIRPLSTRERLQLVRLIMDELADTAPSWMVDEADSWSTEDIEDITRAALIEVAARQGGVNDDA